MEIGQGPNWGCSAKEKNKKGKSWEKENLFWEDKKQASPTPFFDNGSMKVKTLDCVEIAAWDNCKVLIFWINGELRDL
jgi:hypothetical protein